MLRVFRPITTTETTTNAECSAANSGNDIKKKTNETAKQEDIPVKVVRWLNERTVVVKVPCRENVEWVLKFAKKRNFKDVTPWDESAVQRFLYTNEPDFIVPLALDSDYVIALLGKSKIWRPVKASLYIREYIPRKRKKSNLYSDSEQNVSNAAVHRFSDVTNRIMQLLKQSPYVTDATDKDWMCSKKNIIRPTKTAFLFHDFDRNVR